VLLREGLSGLLERAGLTVVAQAGDAEELLAAVRRAPPDLVVVDIRMPPGQGTEGLDAARVIRAESPEIGIVVLSAHVEVNDAMELLATGRGIGYLLKTRVNKVDDFIEAVERVADGGSVVDPALVHELVEGRHREDRLERLTPREHEGASNSGIAKRLWVTDGTVEKHIRSILSKLRLPETADEHRRVLAVLTFLDSR
jgi:DNA-binding NarL/FixJ family response regulator